MTREIKFRAWNIAERKMVDLQRLTPLALDPVMNDQLAMKGGSGIFIPFLDELPIMQFTGLKDKNGKEIYEGDILVIPDSYPYFDESKPNYVSVVEWCFAGFHTVLECVNSDKRGISSGINTPLEEGDEFVVIGNIYETPELLK